MACRNVMAFATPSLVSNRRIPAPAPSKKGTGNPMKAGEADMPMPAMTAEHMFPEEKVDEEGKHPFVQFGKPINMFRETGLRLAMFEVDLLDTSSKTTEKDEVEVGGGSDEDVDDDGSDEDEEGDDKEKEDAKEVKEYSNNSGEEEKKDDMEENRKAATEMLLAMNGSNSFETMTKRYFTAFPHTLPNILADKTAEEKRIALRFDLPQGMSQAHLANYVSSQGMTSLLLPGPKTCGMASQLGLDKSRRFHASLLGARILSAQNTTDVSFCAKLTSSDPTRHEEHVSHGNPAGVMGCPPGCCDKGMCAENSGMYPVLSSRHAAGPIVPESLASLHTLHSKAVTAFNSPDALRLAHITDEAVEAEVKKFLSEDGVNLRLPLPQTEQEALFPDSIFLYLALNYGPQLTALAKHMGTPVSTKKSKKGGRKSLYVTVEVFQSLVQWLKKLTSPSHHSVNLAGPMYMSLCPLDGKHGWNAMRSQGLLDVAQKHRTSVSMSVTLEVCLLMLPRGFEGPPLTDSHLVHSCEEDNSYREQLGLAVHDSLAREAEPAPRRALTKDQLPY